MEENKVTINVSELGHEIKELVEDFKIELELLLIDIEDYIKVEQDNEEEDTPKFKVGDVITGKEPNDYYVTNNESVLVVEGIEGAYIRVKVIGHKLYDDEVGKDFLVEPEHFKLITDIL